MSNDREDWLTREQVKLAAQVYRELCGDPGRSSFADGLERMALAALDMTTLDAMKARHPLIALDAPVADAVAARKALETIKAEALDAWAGYEEPRDPRQMDDDELNQFVLDNGSDGETYARFYWTAKDALHATPATTQGREEDESVDGYVEDLYQAVKDGVELHELGVQVEALLVAWCQSKGYTTPSLAQPTQGSEAELREALDDAVRKVFMALKADAHAVKNDTWKRACLRYAAMLEAALHPAPVEAALSKQAPVATQEWWLTEIALLKEIMERAGRDWPDGEPVDLRQADDAAINEVAKRNGADAVDQAFTYWQAKQVLDALAALNPPAPEDGGKEKP